MLLTDNVQGQLPSFMFHSKTIVYDSRRLTKKDPYFKVDIIGNIEKCKQNVTVSRRRTKKV